jgi:chromosome partitioning protein
MPRLTTAIQKGGTGKTTTAINIGAVYADEGDDVLFIDLDPQGGLTEGIGLGEQYNSDGHIGEILLEDGTSREKRDFDGLIEEREPFDVIPASPEMYNLSEELGQDRAWFKRLDEGLKDLDEDYDWIIIDSPPELNRVSDSALIAAKNVVIPIKVEEPSVRGIEIMLREQIKPIREDLESEVEIVGIVPNETLDSNERSRILEGIKENFEKELTPEVRRRVDINRAWREGKTLFEYDPENDMCDRYREIAEHIRERSEE